MTDRTVSEDDRSSSRTAIDRDPLALTIVTSNYPFSGHPNVGTFVASLADAWARMGDRIDVIAPLPIWSAQTRELVFRHPTWQGARRPTVLRPGFMSYSNRRIGPLSTQDWTVRSFEKATLRAARRHAVLPDLVYSHFLLPAGAAALRLATRLERPAVVALGESGFEQAEASRGRDGLRELLRSFDGILSVSRENAELVIDRYDADPARIEIVPNAVDTQRFRQIDRAEARARLGLPRDSVLLAFAGYFIERKGPLRVAEALRRVEGLRAVFLGDGPQAPAKGGAILHVGRVAHEDVPLWLSAADFFVLPTLAEGSPNAVIEAMACGLPVISSDIPALRETVDPEAAILVDPMDIEALANAMTRLVADPDLRERMGRAALALGQRTSIDDRARRIRAWLREIVARGR